MVSVPAPALMVVRVIAPDSIRISSAELPPSKRDPAESMVVSHWEEREGGRLDASRV